MAETDITRMTSDYADNELELFRKTVRDVYSLLALKFKIKELNVHGIYFVLKIFLNRIRSLGG